MPATPEDPTPKTVQQLNIALASATSGGGRWWNYTVSHREFLLLIGDPGGKGNIVVRLTACDYLSGPMSWPIQGLKVTFDPIERGAAFEIADPAVGFLARANALQWWENCNLLSDQSVGD